MSTDLEPADELAQATRMPRSLCAFVLRITSGDLEQSRGVLERVASEIPGWSRLPQGALWQQVARLAGHAPARPSTVSSEAHEPDGEDVDLDVDVDLSDADDGSGGARARGVADANSVLMQGRMEFRTTEALQDLALTCPICHTLRRYPADVTPPPSCPTCASALIITRPVGEAADPDPGAYCEAFNGRVVEHVRQVLDASFDPSEVQEVAPPPPPVFDEPTEALPFHTDPTATLPPEPTDALSQPSLDELLGTLPESLPPAGEPAPEPLPDATAPELPVGRPRQSTADAEEDALLSMFDEAVPAAAPLLTNPELRAAPPEQPDSGELLPEESAFAPEPGEYQPEPEPESALDRAVLDAEDWRAPLLGLPFELEALMAVRKRATRDAERDLAAGSPKRVQVGGGDAFAVLGDCPVCVQTWSSLPEAPTTLCPSCASALALHTALGGEVDEAALAYQSAYNEAVQGAFQAINPSFAWHLLAEAPPSVHERLARAAGVHPAVAAVAYDVSAGDEAAALELLDWLGGKVSPEGKSDEELREAALAALAEIGAEPDEEEVQGRRLAEQLLQRGELAHHLELGPHVACPGCLQRWPSEGDLPPSCVQCGGPLVSERNLVEEQAISTRAAEALNTRVERHIRTNIAPGFEWSQVQGP